MLTWSLRTAATFGLLALVARGPESAWVAVALAAVALVAVALAARPRAPRTA